MNVARDLNARNGDEGFQAELCERQMRSRSTETPRENRNAEEGDRILAAGKMQVANSWVHSQHLKFQSSWSSKLKFAQKEDHPEIYIWYENYFV